MTCSTDLGDPLDRWDLTLNRGGSFDREMVLEDESGPWEPPPGTAVRLVFGAPYAPTEAWEADISGATATFSRSAAQIDEARLALPAGTPVRLIVTVPPEDPIVWSVGAVMWQ